MKLLRFLAFLPFYLKEVVLSNLRVAYDVLTPTHHMKPAIIALPISDLSDRQLMFLANLITMTPGTLSIDIADDRHTLFIHTMYLDSDPETYKANLKADYEKRIRNAF